jgi:hypothetical protein
MRRIVLLALFFIVLPGICLYGQHVFHVSVMGNDNNSGSKSRPLRTISAAARLAQPGDIITVHQGVYRERIDPPRGGISDTRRIIYQAAQGEKVEIKGSEIIRNWRKIDYDTWKAVIPNSFFGDFNPYIDTIHGDWFEGRGRLHHTGEVYLDGLALTEAADIQTVLQPSKDTSYWYCQTIRDSTAIWAQFRNTDPNSKQVEINVRQTIFYPKKTGINYITLRGFIMKQAATPWAPPTAEQIGLIGTHWSKGWIIEDNSISDSKNSGIALGKYGDQWDNKAESAEGYVGTIKRALDDGWNGETVGHHIVRNNHIFDCGQAGIVGSLGAIFSTITYNSIHDIHIRQRYTGAEVAGIKLHGAIDVEIAHNHIYHNIRGIWLDWMAQGTRVESNLFHDNRLHDLYMEVDHGPFLINNNIFLSDIALFDRSEGGAFTHNLVVGRIKGGGPEERKTPYFQPHSTKLVDIANLEGGDIRFYNNVFCRREALDTFKKAAPLIVIEGNVFLTEKINWRWQGDSVFLEIPTSIHVDHPRVTTTLLGKTKLVREAFELPDASPISINTDYFGQKRNTPDSWSGPFRLSEDKAHHIKVWPLPGKNKPT